MSAYLDTVRQARIARELREVRAVHTIYTMWLGDRADAKLMQRLTAATDARTVAA